MCWSSFSDGMLSLLVGGSLLGLWGMLLAVPVVAAVKVVVLYVWDTRAQWPPGAEPPTASRRVMEAMVAEIREGPEPGRSGQEAAMPPRRRLSG